MKGTREIIYGFILFFIIDRTSRLISSHFAIRRKLSELEMERMRAMIELVALGIALVIFSPREVGDAIQSSID